MRINLFNIFKRIGVSVFILITILCLLFMSLTYFTTSNFHEASTQLLNKDVAAHIAKFSSPFENGKINKLKADSVFYNAMVISPSAEVYFLDTTGKIMAFHAPENDIKLWNIPLENIYKLIASEGKKYIKGPDPKEPGDPKIFSAAEVRSNHKQLGYIYVILGSNKGVSNMLYTSYFNGLLVKVSLVIIVLSLIFSLIYFSRIQRSFNRMIKVLDRFQDGDFSARFEAKENDELAPVTHSFNKMADLLVYNIDQLTKSENERKNFIATISHDLRTPLSIVKGYTETLLIKKPGNGLNEEVQDQYLRLVLQKATQVESLVQQLFELSKMEADSFKPNKEPFVLSEIVQEIINVYQLISEEKKVSLKCTQCQYHVWVNADIAMMERVFQNLIDNAINNTPEGGKIQLSIVADKNDLIFSIENSGSPIPSDILNWINELREESSFSGSHPTKLGLGLLIVKRILHLHQYQFMAAAEAGIGNRFTIVIPIVQNTPSIFSA